MNNEILGSQFAARAVGAIFDMNDADLKRLSSELGIEMSVRELQFCRSYFDRALHRAPLVAELLFIAEYLRARRSSPLSLLPCDLTFASEDTARAFTDMAKKQEQLTPEMKDPLPLPSLINVAGNYLKRAGHMPPQHDLWLINEAQLALFAGKTKSRATLPLGDFFAALVPCEEARKVTAPMTLLSIKADEPQQLPHLTAKIMECTAHLGAVPIAYIGKEGLFPHLADLENGVELFFTLPTNAQETTPYSALNVSFCDTALFALPEGITSLIIDSGMPVKPVGRLLTNDALVMHFGAATVSLDRRFLRELCTLATQNLNARIPDKATALYRIEHTATDNELLCGTVCEGDAIPALLDLLFTAYKAGIRAKELSLCTILTCNKENFPQAISLAADLHRVVSELSLASLPATVKECDKAAPTLTVALTAPLEQAPSEAELAAFEDAVKRKDYPTLRALFYQIAPPKNNV